MAKVDDLLAWLIPRRCVLCNRPGATGSVCADCHEDLPWLPALVGARGGELPGGGRVLAALSYEYPVDRMVTGAKFHRQLHFARALGELLATTVATAGVALPDLVLPVPLHRQRLSARGYNQALEIARPIATALRLPLAPGLCERRKPTTEQTGLAAEERRGNLRGAFAVIGPCAGARIAIVDDVITTGSTAASLAGALRAAGAAEVEVWAAARTL